LIDGAASATERAALIAEGLDYAQRHGQEQAQVTYLLSMRSGLEFGTGEWDALLATVSRMHPAAPVYRYALVARAWITVAREGPAAALPLYAELASRAGGDETARIASRTALAAGLAEVGQLEEARAHLAALSELIAPYRPGVANVETPRSLLGGPGTLNVLIAALLLEEPKWIGIIEAEIGNVAIAATNRHGVAAARALVAGDAVACARALDAGYALSEHTGFAANWHRAVIVCVRVATERGLALGAEWAPVSARAREFAQRAGAKWWLEVLEKAGL
jgi:hypothetical protein